MGNQKSKFLVVPIMFIAAFATGPVLHSLGAIEWLPKSIFSYFAAGFFLLATGLFVWWMYYRKEILLFRLCGWKLGATLLIGLLVISFSLASPKPAFPFTATEFILKVVYFFLFVGLAEELWFRGIIFAIFKNRFIPCVILGSLLFGLAHLTVHSGLDILLFNMFAGFCFATARFRGVSIIVLAISHTVYHLVRFTVFAEQVIRHGPKGTFMIFICSSLILTMVLLLLPKFVESFRIKSKGIRSSIAKTENSA